MRGVSFLGLFLLFPICSRAGTHDSRFLTSIGRATPTLTGSLISESLRLDVSASNVRTSYGYSQNMYSAQATLGFNEFLIHGGTYLVSDDPNPRQYIAGGYEFKLLPVKTLLMISYSASATSSGSFQPILYINPRGQVRGEVDISGAGVSYDITKNITTSFDLGFPDPVIGFTMGASLGAHFDRFGLVGTVSRDIIHQSAQITVIFGFSRVIFFQALALLDSSDHFESTYGGKLSFWF